VELRQSRGFLSNLVADETGCGSFDSPWWLAAESGQRLRLTLYDFAAGVQQSSAGKRGSSFSTSKFSGRHHHSTGSGGRMVVCRLLFLCFCAPIDKRGMQSVLKCESRSFFLPITLSNHARSVNFQRERNSHRDSHDRPTFRHTLNMFCSTL